ncbi:MAG: hypothetical protein ACRDK9_10260 [Solirubrobacterales bacterium]
MRRPLAIALCVLSAFGALGVAGCGEEEELEVVEGEPLHLGELSYNVQLTRFLNPDDNEDAEYLIDQDPAPSGEAYLGVFMVIDNGSGDAQTSASEFTIADTTEQHFEPLSSDSPYALEAGEQVPAEGQLPLADTTAASGPIQGAMLLFLVPDAVTENRPLELEIAGADETGHVELDI